MSKIALGIDLGGTNIKAGLVDGEGLILSRVKIATQAERGHAVIISRIAHAAKLAVSRAGIPWSRILAVGIGVPGIFDPDTGAVSKSPNLPQLDGLELTGPIRERLPRKKLPTVLENDANVAAYAEAWIGPGRGGRALALFTLGTGVGGGIILDGKIWRGAWGTAGELGHMNLFPDGPLCNCGNRGCLEVYASATGLVRRFNEAIAAGKRCSLRAQARKEGGVSARDIAVAAQAGDELCSKLIAETGRYLGIGVMNILHILNVERVVFAGGMIAAGDQLLEPIREEARKRTMPLAFRGVEILFSHLGNDAGLIGAAGWALRSVV